MADMNGLLAATLIALSQKEAAQNFHIGYVDTHNNGELLKETYEVDVVPSIRLVKGDQVCILKWANGLWSADDIKEFVSGGYTNAPCTFKRERVSDGLLLTAEYILNDIVRNRYTETMEMYITLRKTLEDVFGYKHDLKSVNPAFGKKKHWRKSQMRTLIIHVILPASIFLTVLSTLLIMCLFRCICALFCSKKNQGVEADNAGTRSHAKREDVKKRD